MEQHIVIDGENCYVETPIDADCVCIKRELVMTKEVFIQCYNKWIKEDKDGSN